MRIIKLLIMPLVAIAFFACEPTYEKQYNWAYPVAGDWKAIAYDMEGNQLSDPFEMRTYNSSMGKDSIWIDDYAAGNFWAFKVKVPVNVKAQTFGVKKTSDVFTNAFKDYPISITVNGGQVIGKDSISFKIFFEDAPDNGLDTILIKGHRETSYDEYMNP